MNICFHGLSLMDYKGEEINDVFFLKKLIDEIDESNKCFYLYNEYGIGINNKQLYECMNLKAKRICIDEYVEMESYEYKRYSEAELNEIVDFNCKLNKKIKGYSLKEDLIYLSIKCLENIKLHDEKYNIDLFVFWGNSIYSNILRAYCKKNNKKYCNLENGLFRPFTLMVDSSGVNYESSISKDIEFYKKIDVDNIRYEKYLTIPEKAIVDDSELIYYRKKFYEDLGIFIDRKDKVNINKSNSTKFDYEYIYIPLQLETDSQIIKHSKNIKTMRNMIEIIIEQLSIYNKKYQNNLKAIVKVHPLYKSEFNIVDYEEIKRLCTENDIEILYEGDNDSLIKNSKAVVTINSTVGIQALTHMKPVITLGDSLYSIEGIVYKCDITDDLWSVIDKAICEGADEDVIRKYLYYLRFEYLVEIFKSYPDKWSINNIIQVIMKGDKVNEKYYQTN